MVGKIKAKPGGLGTVVECEFRADTVSFGHAQVFYSGSSYGSSSGYKPVVRHNFTVDDKCALGDDWFLPQYMRGSSGMGVTDKGLKWYQGKINKTVSTSSYTRGTSCYSSMSSQKTTWDVTLNIGASYKTK